MKGVKPARSGPRTRRRTDRHRRRLRRTWCGPHKKTARHLVGEPRKDGFARPIECVRPFAYRGDSVLGRGYVRALFDPVADRGGAAGKPDQPVDELALAKQAERRASRDAVADRDLRVGVGVELADLDFARELARELLHDRGHHLAGRTPDGREVDHDRLLGLEHIGLESRAVEVLQIIHAIYKAARSFPIPWP